MEYVKKNNKTEICNHCGMSVALGSGKYVNRIPDFNDVETRVANKRVYLNGNFVCEQCDNSHTKKN